MLEIKLSSQAGKIIQKIPHKDACPITQKIDILATFHDTLSSKAIIWHKPLRRIRVWNYRVVYYIERDILQIYVIGKRNDDEVYRKLQRKR